MDNYLYGIYISALQYNVPNKLYYLYSIFLQSMQSYCMFINVNLVLCCHIIGNNHRWCLIMTNLHVLIAGMRPWAAKNEPDHHTGTDWPTLKYTCPHQTLSKFLSVVTWLKGDCYTWSVVPRSRWALKYPFRNLHILWKLVIFSSEYEWLIGLKIDVI